MHPYAMLSLGKARFVDGHCRAVLRKVALEQAQHSRSVALTALSGFASRMVSDSRSAVLEFAIGIETA
jgi:hypothetical protein